MQGPSAIIAEITHRCPLHCVYCSNPQVLQRRSSELQTSDWLHVFAQAAELGVYQVHLTGGEPVARRDLVQLVEGARKARLYTNLITSGIGLNADRLQELVSAGLDHIQLSFQDVDEAEANLWAGTRAHAHKLALAAQIRKHHIGFTVNIVVHRNNLHRLSSMIEMAEQLEADKLEIANVQYYGWALRNQAALLPTREQLRASIPIVSAAEERLRGKMRIEFVLPDYYGKYPKPCMGGWGRTLMLIDPAGYALPCHAAGVIPSLQFDSVKQHSMAWIWQESEAFNRFRGQGWMQEPCKSCERRELDFGGCRCQALMLAGDASATDPVCTLSPQRRTVDAILASAQSSPQTGVLISPSELIYRTDPV